MAVLGREPASTPLTSADIAQGTITLDDISFTATDRGGEKIIINSDYVKKNLDELVIDSDLSKFIL